MSAIACVALVGTAGRGAEIRVDDVMRQDPRIEFPEPRKVFRKGFTPLWRQALDHSEADLKRQAIEAVIRARRKGMPDLEKFTDPLLRIVQSSEEHPLVRRAAARALIALDVRRAAPVLLRRAQEGGRPVAQVVEPVLARWDYGPAREVWLRRLENTHAPRILRKLAMRGLGTIGERKATPHLLTSASDASLAADLRLEAGRALGQIETDGLVKTARRLAADKSSAALVDRLVAASLLARHQGNETEALLRELAVDPQPAVGGIALRRLLELDASQVVTVADKTIDSPDANVRLLTARGLAARPSRQHVTRLRPLLDDPHPRNRGEVREALYKLATEHGLRAGVIDEAMRMLNTERWRGLEQSALLLGTFDHEPSADRLLELLEFPRPEVSITAAWALRRLAVRGTLGPMLQHAERQADLAADPASARRDTLAGITGELSQLFQAFGSMRYKPAEPLLRRFIPKGTAFAIESRAAAIWALGHLHAGSPEAGLSTQLKERLADVDSLMPEAPPVRRMAAVTLGRMQARDALTTLRRFYELETANSEVGYACGWAVHRITGEDLPEPQPGTRAVDLMNFLQPLKRTDD